jgi:hypothetical protein
MRRSELVMPYINLSPTSVITPGKITNVTKKTAAKAVKCGHARIKALFIIIRKATKGECFSSKLLV